jgi:hypothetical protein
MTPTESEKVLAMWVFILIYAISHDVSTWIIVLLTCQMILSFIATIINTYKQNGTKKRKTKS